MSHIVRKPVLGVSNYVSCASRDLKFEIKILKTIEPRSEKTGLRGFRPGPKQTRLYSDRRWLED